jgi:hypothetical protein
VTEVGAVVRVEPLMGEVVIKEFADADAIPRNEKASKKAVISFNFTAKPLCEPSIRSYRPTSLDLVSTPARV